MTMMTLTSCLSWAGSSCSAEEGLSTCFPNRLHLDDYTPAELAQICEMYARPSTLAHARTRVTEEPELRLNALKLG